MKNLLLLMCCFLGLSTALSAQNPRQSGAHSRYQQHGREHVRAQVGLLDSLELSTAQREQILAIRKEMGQAIREQRGSMKNLPDDEQRKAFGEMARIKIDEFEEKIQGVLTPAQRSRYTALKAERKEAQIARLEALKARRQELEPMRQELKAYRKATVLPAMAQLRQDFDRQLSSKEKQQIAQLRSAIRAERSQHRSAGVRPSREEHKAQRHAFHEAHKAEFEAVDIIAKTHQTSLSQIREQLKARESEWENGADEIRAKYLSPEEMADDKVRGKHGDQHHRRLEGVDHPTNQRGKHMRGPDKEGAHAHGNKSDEAHRHHDAKRGELMFLLMDPNSPADDLEEDEQEDFTPISDNSKVEVFPNPAGNRTNVQFEIRQSGPVKVELIDAAGKVQQVLLNERREAGNIKLEIDLSQNGNPTSILRITDALGVRTQMVSHQK